MKPIFAALALAAWLAPAAAMPSAASADKPLARADRSFSAVPFGTKRPSSGLSHLDKQSCRTWGECYYIDADRVRHCFCDPVGALAVKWIDEIDEEPIAALGIGLARLQPDVIARVERFLPEAKIRCSAHTGDPDSPYSCFAFLAPGWVTLRFDAGRRLVEIRLDAYHFT